MQYFILFYFISNSVQYEALDSGIQNQKSFKDNLEQIFKVRKALSLMFNIHIMENKYIIEKKKLVMNVIEIE